jgi:hypothetical protein
MGLSAMISRMAEEDEGEESRITDPKQIMKALKRAKLEGLKYGDKLAQVKHGDDYNYKFPEKGKQAIFIRYLTEEEKSRFNFTETNQIIRDVDMLICCGISKSDGELMKFAVNSTFFKLA